LRVPGLISGVVGARRGFEMYLCSATSGRLLSVAMVNSKQIGTNTILQLLNLLPEHIQKYYLYSGNNSNVLVRFLTYYLPTQNSTTTIIANPFRFSSNNTHTRSANHYTTLTAVTLSSATRLKRCCLINRCDQRRAAFAHPLS
jgi:hypothetical protein